MSGVRQIKLDVSGKIEDDQSVSLNFALTGLRDYAEADAMIATMAPKLRHTIVRMLKKRGVTIHDQRKGAV